MFEGKLKPLPFKLSNAKSFLGAVFFQREKNPDDTWHYYGLVFKMGHLHNHVGLTENFDQSENEEFLVNDSP